MSVETNTPDAPDTQPQAPAEAPAARSDWASVPRVNLLPQEILEARRFKGTQRLLALAVVAVVALLGAATWWEQSQVATAREALATEQQRTSELNAEQAKYAQVPRLLAQVTAARGARERAMSADVLWYRFLNDLATATPAGVSLESVAATLSPTVPGAPAATTTVPLKPAGIGDIAVEGSANSFDRVSDWLDNLGEVSGLDSSTLSNASREAGTGGGKPEVSFSTGVTMTGDALSHRYEQKAG
jgi:Tfp pilus assembly protein PilN